MPGPQMIPKLDPIRSRTGNDPHIGPQMIPMKEILNGMDGRWDGVDRESAHLNTDVFIKAILS